MDMQVEGRGVIAVVCCILETTGRLSYPMGRQTRARSVWVFQTYAFPVSAAMRPLPQPFLLPNVPHSQVGHDYLTSVYNPATRRRESEWRTDWKFVHPDWRYDREYQPGDLGMQVRCACAWPRCMGIGKHTNQCMGNSTASSSKGGNRCRQPLPSCIELA